MKFVFIKPRKVDAVVVITESGKLSSEVVLRENGAREIRIKSGKAKDMTGRKLIKLIRQVIASAKSVKAKSISLYFNDFVFPKVNISKEELAEMMAVNFMMANFAHIKHKTPPKNGWPFVEKIYIKNAENKKIQSAFKKGVVIGEGVNFCRELCNTPGGDMTPTILAGSIVKAAKGTGIKALKSRVLSEPEIKQLKMGAILGVSRGSDERPKFIILDYKGGRKGEKPVILVGKGVTFDTGGLNLKPEGGILDMHLDMSGGAAVASAVIIAAKLKVKKNIVALIPAVENMPSGSSYRPGDVLKSMSGKTIEVLNTDAEGRVILADALTYAERYKPEVVIDVATLTGAALVALGQRCSALFTHDDKLADKMVELGERTGDLLWRMPLWEEYESEIKGSFGDWANLGKTRYGGAITAASFLHQFAKNYKWAHIDIAPRMVAIEDDLLSKGAIGSPVRMLVRFLEK